MIAMTLPIVLTPRAVSLALVGKALKQMDQNALVSPVSLMKR